MYKENQITPPRSDKTRRKLMNNFTAHFYKVTDTEIVATGKTELYPAVDRKTAVEHCLYTHRLHNGNATASWLGVITCPSCGQIAVVKDKNQEEE